MMWMMRMITPCMHTRTTIRITKTTGREIDLAKIIACVPYQEILIVVESGVQVTVYDSRVDAHAVSLFRSILIHVCENAHMTYIDRRHCAGDEFSLISIQADTNSTVLYQGLYTGAGTTKTTLNLILAGVGAQGDIRIGSVVKGKSCHVVNSMQRHDVSQTTSRCVVRSVVYDDACTNYDGIVHILPQVKKIVSHQFHKSLLMGDHACATARPKLEIFSHDVECGHGSAIGQLDDEQLLYLQCRGLRHIDARRLLIGAFFDDLYTDDLLLRAVGDVVF